MKKSTRLISVLMAMILCFGCMSVGVSAEYYDYSHPAGYDALDHPYISAYQCGSMILDMVDKMLAEKDLTGDIDAKVVSNFHYDLTSIDKALDTLVRLYNHDLYKIGTGILDLGDLEKLTINSIKTAPKRTASGRTDIEVLVALFNFLNENKTLIGKVVDGKWDNGGLISRWLDINKEVGNVHQMIKDAIYNGLLGDAAEKGTAVATNESAVDTMVNEFVYNMLVKGDFLPSFEKVMIEGGKMKGPGLANFSLNTMSVYDLFRYVLRAAIIDFGKPLLTDLLAGNGDILPLITGLLEIEVPEVNPATGAAFTDDELVAFLVEDLLDLRNGALSKFITVKDEGISLTADFQGLLSNLLDTAKGLMSGLTSYDTVAKWDEETLAELTEPQTLAYLVRTVLMSLVDFADIPLTMPVRHDNGTVTEEPINGYAVATYMMINVMADKMPGKDYYAMIENYKKNGPGQQINPGQEPVLIRNSSGQITKYVEPSAMAILADFAYYYLNATTTMDIPAGLNFDETFQWVINWAVKQWGGLVRTDNIDLVTKPTTANMVVWKNLDILLWENVFNITWLPDDYVASFKDASGNYTGNVTRSLLLDNMVYTLINLDMSQLNNILSVFNAYRGTIKGYPSSELDLDVINFVLTMVKRLLNGLMNSNNALFNGTTIVKLEDIVSKTEYNGKTNLRTIVENLATLLPKYGESILVSALPLFAESLADMDEYAHNYDIFPTNGETYTIEDLREKLESQQPSNKLNADMMTDKDYFFFGSEDFSPLYKFYNYRDARKEAERFLDTYDKETAGLADGSVKERSTTQEELDALTFRLGYYFNRLSITTPDVTQLKRELDNAKAKYGYGAYGSATSKGSTGDCTQFTLKTWNYYNSVYTFANSVYREFLLDDSGSLRQSKISAAREMLVMAQKMLKYFAGEADYSALDRQISLALQRITESVADSGLFMPETIVELRNVYNMAIRVDRGLDGDSQNEIDEATLALEEAIENLVYNPQLAKTVAKGTVLDKEYSIVYGLAENLSNFYTYIRVLGVGVMNVVESKGGKGTGTKIGLQIDDKIVQEYTVVIFGDIDGDCAADATDANLIYAYAANLLPAQYLSSFSLMASDANNDGSVDVLDAYYLRQSGMQKFTVDQRAIA